MWSVNIYEVKKCSVTKIVWEMLTSAHASDSVSVLFDRHLTYQQNEPIP
jgi:hypothetical protein